MSTAHLPHLPRLPAERPSREDAADRHASPRLLRGVVRLDTATLERLNRCVEAARVRLKGEVLQGKVGRAAVIRAAVAIWLEDPVQGVPDVVNQAIRAAIRPARSAGRRHRYPQYWPPEMVARLEVLASAARAALGREDVTPATVVRVALAASWLGDATLSEPVLQAIRAALVKRGRKPTS